jgi:toxin ParE1/3/4
MKYRLSREAENDLICIYQCGRANFRELQADKYFYAFFDQFEIISKQPHAYPLVDNIRFGYRRCVCGVDSIYYKITQNEIEIMAIIGRQDYDYLK